MESCLDMKNLEIWILYQQNGHRKRFGEYMEMAYERTCISLNSWAESSNGGELGFGWVSVGVFLAVVEMLSFNIFLS